jgi:hypothetical protein
MTIRDSDWLIVIAMRDGERWDDPDAEPRGAMGFNTEAEATVALDKLKRHWPGVSAGVAPASEWAEELRRCRVRSV